MSERTLLPGDDAQLGEVRFEDWLNENKSRGSPSGSAGPRPRVGRTAMNANEFRVADIPPGSSLASWRTSPCSTSMVGSVLRRPCVPTGKALWPKVPSTARR